MRLSRIKEACADACQPDFGYPLRRTRAAVPRRSPPARTMSRSRGQRDTCDAGQTANPRRRLPAAGKPPSSVRPIIYR